MTRASTMVLCLGAALAAGCTRAPKQSPGAEERTTLEATASNAPEAPEAAPPQVQAPGWATTPLALGAGPVVVKEGPAPLVHLVETRGTFRVHDQTERKDLARAEVPGRATIRVDARSGVVFGREALYAGPLPADHRYVIYFDPAGPNFSRQGVFQPRPAK